MAKKKKFHRSHLGLKENRIHTHTHTHKPGYYGFLLNFHMIKRRNVIKMETKMQISVYVTLTKMKFNSKGFKIQKQNRKKNLYCK